MDTKGRGGWAGAPMSFPRIIPHQDGAGVIDRVGPEVPATRLGERVWPYEAQHGRAGGTAAEYAIVPSANAVALPEGVPFEVGACLGVPVMTAHRCLFADGDLRGQWILVQGGVGAVGLAAVLLAKWAGAHLDVVDRTMAEDVESVVISAVSPAAHDALPWVGRRRGREAVKAYMRRLVVAQPTSALPIERWVADDDTVVAFGTVATRSAVRGRERHWELAFRFDMRDGLIQRYHFYKDSLSATLLHRAAFRAPNKPYGGPVRPPSAQPETERQDDGVRST